MLHSLFVTVTFYSTWLTLVGCNEFCKTDSCETTATRILNYMDPDVKPCDDFYRFTCGKFLKSGLPEGKSVVSAVKQVEEAVNLQIRKLLEEPIEPNEHVAYKATKKFYSLCMEEKNSTSNVEVVSDRLRSAGWPVLGGWREDEWSLHGHEAKLRPLTRSRGSLFHVKLGPDPHNPGQAQITIDQPKLTKWFLREQDTDNKLVDMLELPRVRLYQDYMVDIAVMFGADRQAAKQQLRDSLLFKLDLEKAIQRPKRRHRPYELMTVAELQDRAGWVDWPALLAATVVPKSLSLSDDELIKVYEPDYLDRTRQLIERHPNRVIANFMGWNAAERLSQMLTPEMIARNRQFDEDDDDDEIKEPWQKCVQLVGFGNLGLAVASMYAKRYMTEETRQTVTDLTANLRGAMYSIIKSDTDWMEDATKTKALLKLCKMHEYIGHPKQLTKTEEIDSFYKGLDLDKFTDFVQTEIYIGEWMEEQGKFQFEKSWVSYGFDATMVNAYYDPETNQLQLMAAILQLPFFNAGLPKYIHYATMGMLAGHEITHGFDNNGVKHDEDGAKKNWWDDSSKMNFDEKSECMLNQYSDYIDKCNATEEGGPIPYLAGNSSLGEVIGDNGGLKLAFLAYKKLSEQLAKPEPLLPNLEQFTRDQMFFISLGNLWCTLEDAEKQRAAPPEDEHPPAEYRVNGVLQNFPQFSEAFECKAGTKMNPKEKCSVW